MTCNFHYCATTEPSNQERNGRVGNMEDHARGYFHEALPVQYHKSGGIFKWGEG